MSAPSPPASSSLGEDDTGGDTIDNEEPLERSDGDGPDKEVVQVWGGKAPSNEERLHVMQEMFEGRQRLDHILARFPSDPTASPDRAALRGGRKGSYSLRCGDDAVFQEAVEVLEEEKGVVSMETFQEVLSRVFGGGVEEGNRWSRELKVPLPVAIKWDKEGSPPLTVTQLPTLSSVELDQLKDVQLHLEDVGGQTDRQVPWTSTEEVIQQVRMAVQRMDRIMPTSEAEEQAVTALRSALFCLSSNEECVTRSMEHLFRGAVGLDIVRGTRRHVRLRFGLRQWRPESFGLGLFAESYFRVRLLQKGVTMVEDNAEGAQPPPAALATLLCGCSHAFYLTQEQDFADALSDTEEVAAGLPCDLSVSQVSLRLRLMEAGDNGDSESTVSGEGMDGAISSEESVGPDGGPGNNMSNSLLFRRRSETPVDGDAGTYRAGGRKSLALGTINSRALVAQVYGWGDNQCGCLGFQGEGIRAEPRTLPAISSLPIMERVSKVALSSRHVLILTSLGSVYSCGDGTDGALGHGDLLSINRFRMVDYFARQKPPPLITGVSAASDILGSHSAAVDSDGRLYTWGFGQATGHSVAKPVQEPRDLTDLLGEDKRVLAVACGGAFCLALVQGGQVYSWGLWAHGRLGLGPATVQVDTYNRRRVHKYKLRPALIKGRLAKESVIRIAAGTGHSLAVTESGLLYSWGRDDFGQLGLDAKTSNGFVSVFEPELVSCFNGAPGRRATDAACGAFHSLALDDRGQLWTWGAAGGPCLGHGDAVSVEGRPVDLPSLLRKQQAVDKRLPILATKPVWAVPRRVEALANLPIRRISGGSHHSAAVTDDGQLFLWGESLSTLQPVLDEEEDEEEEGRDDDEREEEDEREGDEDKDETESSASEGKKDKPVDLEGVHVPCQPNTHWLPQLSGKWIETAACGGHNTIVVASGDRVAMVLGRRLLQGASKSSSSSSGDDEVSVTSVRSFVGTEGTERDGNPPADVLLLVSGRVVHAHKLILARRSATFRDLIAAEERPGDLNALQLVLPDLRYDVAKALLQYIYTDNLFGALDFRSSLPVELLAAAEAYQLPRLVAICQSFLGQKTPGGAKKLPACMMPADVGGGLGDTAWADVRFIASGRALLAHRFILAAQSEYFCAMFRSGMREGAIRGNAPVEIAVPDSYASMARILLFIYSGTLTANSNDDVIEDLMAADRYRLLELKKLCESMVHITPGNCLEVWRIADMYAAPRLREAALSYTVRHLSRVASQPGYLSFAEANPYLMRVLFDKIKATSPHTYNTEEEAEGPDRANLKKPADDENFKPGPFPWIPIAILIVCGLVYREASRMIALGPLIPALNIGLTVALVIYGLTVMK